MHSIFPFTAIVGQEQMRMALLLNAINPRIGGVLIRGERGSAKSTAARGLAAILPRIRVVADCHFSCDPDSRNEQCDRCQTRVVAGESLPVTERPTSFVNLPVSATEDRVVGTLDIEKAIKQGERHFEPGVLASANRGLLYIDEVNLLDDHVVDLLLDCAAMGVNVVEREGISFSHPSRFILVGSMNPEEGDLRPQLLDRFALCVDIRSIKEPTDRMKIVERTLRFETDPAEFCRQWTPEGQRLSDGIARARELHSRVRYTPVDLLTIGELMTEMHVDGHRADIVILKTALTHAALEGRDKIETEDIFVAAELTLPHRLKRKPLQDPSVQMESLTERLDQIRQQKESEAAPTTLPSAEEYYPQEKKTKAKP